MNRFLLDINQEQLIDENIKKIENSSDKKLHILQGIEYALVSAKVVPEESLAERYFNEREVKMPNNTLGKAVNDDNKVKLSIAPPETFEGKFSFESGYEGLLSSETHYHEFTYGKSGQLGIFIRSNVSAVSKSLYICKGDLDELHNIFNLFEEDLFICKPRFDRLDEYDTTTEQNFSPEPGIIAYNMNIASIKTGGSYKIRIVSRIKNEEDLNLEFISFEVFKYKDNNFDSEMKFNYFEFQTFKNFIKFWQEHDLEL